MSCEPHKEGRCGACDEWKPIYAWDAHLGSDICNDCIPHMMTAAMNLQIAGIESPKIILPNERP